MHGPWPPFAYRCFDWLRRSRAVYLQLSSDSFSSRLKVRGEQIQSHAGTCQSWLVFLSKNDVTCEGIPSDTWVCLLFDAMIWQADSCQFEQTNFCQPTLGLLSIISRRIPHQKTWLTACQATWLCLPFEPVIDELSHVHLYFLNIIFFFNYRERGKVYKWAWAVSQNLNLSFENGRLYM